MSYYRSWSYVSPNETQAIAQAAEAAAALDSSPTLSPGESCVALAASPVGYPRCQFARPCRSCLLKSGCAVTSGGSCSTALVDASSYELDYRKAIDQQLSGPSPNATTWSSSASPGIQNWQFPAGTATYCNASDSICTECRAKRFGTGDSGYFDSRFCVGAGGCVCIANCVDPDYAFPTAYMVCSHNYVSNSTRGMNSMVPFVMASVLLLILFGIIASLCYAVRRRRVLDRNEEEQRRLQREAQAARRQERMHQMSTQLGVGLLSLSSWKAYRQNQIQNEDRQLSGLHDIVPSSASPTMAAMYELVANEQAEYPHVATAAVSTVGTPRNGLR